MFIVLVQPTHANQYAYGPMGAQRAEHLAQWLRKHVNETAEAIPLYNHSSELDDAVRQLADCGLLTDHTGSTGPAVIPDNTKAPADAPAEAPSIPKETRS